MLHLGFLIAAFVLFSLAAFIDTPRVNLIAAGLALLTLSLLFAGR